MPRRDKTQETGYSGNPLLPLATEQIQLSDDELTEFVRCAQDCEYFVEHYVKIIHVDRGIVSFQLWDFQREIIQTFMNNRFVICKLSRQCGKSTTVVCGYFLWYAMFHADVSLCILANKEVTAIELLRRFKQSYELLPRFLKQGVVKWDQKLVMFGNNSRIRAEATSASAVRGDSFNCILLDEFAHVAENIAQEFMTSVYPTITSGKTTKMFVVSTPNGYNLFYKIWHDAEERRNSYIPIGYTWRDVPGRDACNEQGENIWEIETRKNIGDAQFEAEFNCSFQGSANTLIPPQKLSQLTYRQPIERRGDLLIYNKPIYQTEEGPAHIYLMTVDVSQGQGLDFSVINITDISSRPWKQVAIYRNNKISPTLLTPYIRDIGRYYNDAFAFLEINNEGQSVADMLANEMEYEHIISIYPNPKRGQQLSTGFNPRSRQGLRMSEATKRIGCTGLKSLISGNQYLIADYETLRELTTYVAKNQSYAAEAGSHDDIMSTLVLLGWLTLQSGFEHYVGLSMREILLKEHETITFDAPFLGVLGDAHLPPAPKIGPSGYEVVEDPGFWREGPSNWLL